MLDKSIVYFFLRDYAWYKIFGLNSGLLYQW